MRALADETAIPIPGSDRGSSPFFSPDDQWLAFEQDGRLKKMPAGGGAAIDYGDALVHQGGSFAPDGTLMFNAQLGSGLSRVRPGSTTPEVLTTSDRTAGEAGHHWPDVLPDGKQFVLIQDFARPRASVTLVQNWFQELKKN